MGLVTVTVLNENLSDSKIELSNENIKFQTVTSKGFNGVDIASVVVDLASVSIPTLAYVIIKFYKSKKLVELKIGNTAIKTNIDNLESIIKLLNDEKNQ